MTELPRFERLFFQGDAEISMIGSGSIGGKASGLVAARSVLDSVFPGRLFKKTKIYIPRMAVIACSCFDEFLELNNLNSFLSSEHSDDRIAHTFQKASLPASILGDLRSLAQEVHVPLALRSSSLLEDRISRPFAGVYATKMVANNQPSADQRFQKLAEALKFVWASTFFKEAREYRRAAERTDEDEKMAVIVQEIVGERHGTRFYPLISGVARSFNFYPSGRARPEQGVVSLALGLGKTIVDGGICWSYSPASPAAPPPWNSIDEQLKNTQTEFWAVNMGELIHYDPLREDEYLLRGDLQAAEYDNTLRHIASTYDSAADRLTPGTGRAGPRLLNFAPVLALNEPPLNQMVKLLLKGCEDALSNEVEIEFALNIDTLNPDDVRFAFLQMRPMVVSSARVEVDPRSAPAGKVLLYSENALGNGTNSDIRDIVYIRPESFNAGLTPQMALELEGINRRLLEQKRPYLLIGFGRWGSSESWLGIPVLWSQISGAKAIVEAQIPGMTPDLSQGSHFFHNLTSFEVYYLSVPQKAGANINWDLLRLQPHHEEGKLTGHAVLREPLELRVDGRSGRGIVIIHD